MAQEVQILAAADPAVTALFESVGGALADNALPIAAGIGVIAAAAFGIKMLWVAWRAASKAVGKAGT